MLSLLHLLHDLEGFVQEVHRLRREAECFDAESWMRIRDMSRSLGIKDEVLLARSRIDQCGRVLRPTADHERGERRHAERRAVVLPWVGPERRRGERRD
jgi:hypothetical protein